MEYDVLIVGAGVAGISCALALKKLGLSCIILNKDTKTKACGGGITDKALALLKILDITSADFISKDAKIIKISKQIFKNGNIRITDYTDRKSIGFSLGISRENFDYVLKEKVIEEGIHIKKINSEVSFLMNGCIKVGEICCRKLVFATGAINFKNYNIKKNIKKTFGFSMEIGAELDIRDDTFYFYMEGNNDSGDYGWIFPIGINKWNIGVWKKDGIVAKKEHFEKFYRDVFLPRANNLFCAGNLKGGFINCGDDSFYKEQEAIYYIGDCAGCSSIKNGEGIYQAIKTGIDAANDIFISLKSGTINCYSHEK